MADATKRESTNAEVQYAAMNPNSPLAKLVEARGRAVRMQERYEMLGQQVAELEAATAANTPTHEDVQVAASYAGTERQPDKADPDHAAIRKVRDWRATAMKLEIAREEHANLARRLPDLDAGIQRAEAELAAFNAAEAQRQQAAVALEESYRKFPNGVRGR